MRQQLRIAIIASTAVLGLTHAFAAPRSEAAKKPDVYASRACDDAAVIVCVGARPSPVKRERKASEPRGAVGRLARLAGMFMGNVDAADVGDFKFRFKLELADRRSFLDD